MWLARDQVEQMIAQARADVPLETCGLVAGRDGRAEQVLPVPNSLRSPVVYEMGGQEFADALAACEFEPLAIYHSHPAGPSGPSPADVAQAYYPDSVYIIISLAQEPPSVQGFQIADGQVIPVELKISGTNSEEV